MTAKESDGMDSLRDEDPPSEVHDAPWVRALRIGPMKDDVRSGKWLLFVSNDDVDEVWSRIKTATEASRLGSEAKAATAANQNSRGKHVICVYTLDWQNQEDVGRVLRELRRMGFAGRVSYKRDSDTLAGVYGSGAATYVSQPDSVDIELRS